MSDKEHTRVHSIELSLSQKQILLDQQVWPDSPHFNVGGIGNIEGQLDIPTYRHAIRVLTQRHKILLTQYHTSSPRWLTIADDELLDIVDVSHLPDPHGESRIICRKMFAEPFSLTSGEKLWQMKLVRLAPQHHLMVARFHHIIMDGFSVALAFRELGVAYNGLFQVSPQDNCESQATNAPDSETALLPYSQFIRDSSAYQASAAWLKDANYWQKCISQPVDSCFNQQHRALKKKWQTKGVSLCDAIHHFETISPVKYADLEAFCQPFKVSIYHLYAAAIAAYFAGVAGQDKLIIGVPVLNRSAKKYKATLGMFAHLVPLNIALPPGMTALQLMHSVNKGLRECYRHAKYPLGEIIKQLPGDGSDSGYTSNVFDIILSYELHDFSVEFGEASLRRIQRHFSSVARYPFTFCICEFHQDDPREIAIEASQGIFTRNEVTNIAARISHIVAQIMQNPDIEVNQLGLVTPDESQIILAGQSQIDHSHKVNDTLFDDFSVQCVANANKIALRWDALLMTYATLQQKVLNMASGLIAFGIAPGDVVAINMPREPDTLVCMLAVMKIRGVYLLLDPESPPAFQNELLKQSRAVMMLVTSLQTQPDKAEAVNSGIPESLKVVTAQTLCEGNGDVLLQTSFKDLKPLPQDTAYILFTSGSTGKPKGVIINHAALAVRIRWLKKQFQFGCDDVFLQSIALSFDPAHIEIFLPLTSGACCALAPDGPVAPSAYLPLIKQFGVTAMIFVPTSLKYFLKQLGEKQQTTLRVVISGGEQLYQKHAEALVRSTGVSLYNLYGPTEACIFASYFHYQSAVTTRHVPIGRPVDSTILYVLDKYQRLLPSGALGELYIGGQGIATGYLDKQQTETSFIANPFAQSGFLYKTGDKVYWDEDQHLSFVTRVDAQIKHRGIRLEPENVEHDLVATGMFSNAAVMLHEGRLCAWLEMPFSASYETNKQGMSRQILDTLMENLPQRHLPEKFFVIEHIPQTTNGKVDYTRLIAAQCARLEMPDDAIDEENDALDPDLLHWLTDTWTRVVGSKPISTRQSFTDAGGDSLAALNMLADIKEKFGCVLPLSFLIKHNSINRIAKAILCKTSEPCQNLSGHENGKRIYCVAAGHGDALKVKGLAESLGNVAHIFLLQPAVSKDNDTVNSVAKIARDYLNQITQSTPQKGFIMAGYSIGGIPALETARLAKQHLLPVEKLILIDSIYPNWMLRKTPLWAVLRKLLSIPGSQVIGAGSHTAATVQKRNVHPGQSSCHNSWLVDEGLNRQLRALRGYQPTLLDVDAVLLVSDALQLWRPLLMQAWHGMFSKLTQERIRGGHATIWDADNVTELANTLKKYCV